MDYALVFKWLKPFPGREAKALEVLADCRTYFGKLAAEGKVTEPMVFTSVNDGMMIVSGEMTFMFDIMNRDDFVVLMDKCMYVAEGFRFDTYFTGELMDQRLGLYAKAGKELAFL
jgi:hypothetical protein